MSRTIGLTMAQAIIKFLDNQYLKVDSEEIKFVKGIFTIFGHGNVLGLGQALEEGEHSLKVHQGRSEQGMAHAAIAYSKQKNCKEIYACTSSIGPGAANMVTAAGTATVNRIPVLFLPGDTYAVRQPDPVLQQVEHENNPNITTNDAFKAVSKYWDRVSRCEQLMSALVNAFSVLTNPQTAGAVTISLPQDVQGEMYDYPLSFFKKRIHIYNRIIPNDEQVDETISIFDKYKKPLIICGGGVRYSLAQKELESFASKYQIPIAETQAGKGLVTSEHPLNLGGVGVTGNSAANTIAKSANLIIAIGSRLGDFTTGSKSLFSPNTKIVSINTTKMDAIKMDATFIVSDAKLAILELTKKMKSFKIEDKYLEEVKKAKDAWDKEYDRLITTSYFSDNYEPEVNANFTKSKMEEYRKVLGSSLTQTEVLGILNKEITDGVIVGSSGSLPGDLQRMWKTKGTLDYHMEYGYSCMGYEVCGALGVKLAEGDSREVYSFVGDGSYLMLHSELITSIQEKAKINVILFDNIGFGCINNLQMGNAIKSYGTEFRERDRNSLDGGLIKIDYAMSARAYGCNSYTARSREELILALSEIKKSKVSTLIDIKVLPKTMTNGYDAWWRVGAAQTGKSRLVRDNYIEIKKELKKIKEY